jgi:hypothetical protein
MLPYFEFFLGKCRPLPLIFPPAHRCGFYVGFSVLSFVVETWLSVRQHRCFHVRTVPTEVASVVKQEVFDKSQEYGLTKRCRPQMGKSLTLEC